MRSSRSMTGDRGHSRALVKVRQNEVILRNSDLAVLPPRPLPLTLKARRSFSKLSAYGAFATVFAIAGYATHDADIRRAVDYEFTLLASPGVSSHTPVYRQRSAAREPLPKQALNLFIDSRKGPRADRFAYALKMGGADAIARDLKADPLGLSAGAQPPQTAAMAGAALFLTALNSVGEAQSPAQDFGAPAAAKAPSGPGEWQELLKNASLSPDSPKTLFGGLTEDEFRTRELRCMATAIYFEARDEPVKGQIAIGQVIMNRIRSPFYPKTICGVVYQGERNRHGCQFSFTCTGRRNVVNEKDEWATAVKLAKQVIAGEVWLDEVGYATHYHATYVAPAWRHELIRVTQIGGHIFYRMPPGTIQLAVLNEGL